jgi:hypothetical protein
MASISFEAVEKECMKALILSPGVKQTQFSIFEKVSSKFEDIIGNNPILKNDLKYITLAVIRSLSVRNDNVIVEDNDGIYYACYYIDMENTKKEINTGNTFVNIPVSEKEKHDMPNNLAVIDFILSNKLTEHYYTKDYLGNTILHYLIMGNHLEKIIDYFYIMVDMINIENNDKKTPLELIKDIRISNFFLVYFIKKNNSNEKTIILHNSNINTLNFEVFNNKKNINTISTLAFMQLIVNIIIIYFLFEHLVYEE